MFREQALYLLKAQAVKGFLAFADKNPNAEIASERSP